MINMLIFYTIYVMGIFSSLLRNPVYAFALYEAVYFFYPQKRWWGYMVPDIGYSFFVVILMMGLVLLNFKQTQQNRLLAVPQFRWMYVLLFLFVITYFYAATPQGHSDASVNFIKLIIIISIAYKLCDSASKLDYVLYGYIFGAWYIGFLTFQVGRNSGSRVEGIGTVDSPDANGIAAAIAPSLVLCLYYFWISKNWVIRGLITIAGIFIANALVLINSRGAFLGTAASLGCFMFYMYFSSFQRKSQKSVAVLITIIGLAGVAVIADESFIQRMSGISNTEVTAEEETGATRTFFWIAAWNMAKDHPFGAGFQGFNFYAPVYIPDNVATGSHRNRTVHSTWFEALSEIGYLGLFAFIMMIYYSYKSLSICQKKLRETNQVDEYFKVIAIGSALLAFIIAMSFLNRMRAEILYWLILYTACAYNIYVLKAQSADPETEHKSTHKLKNKVRWQ